MASPSTMAPITKLKAHTESLFCCHSPMSSPRVVATSSQVIDLQNRKLQKTLRGIHSNICSTVQFHPNRPWEVLSGGLDAKIVKWDFCKGRPLKVIDQGASAASGTSQGQIYNPPFVHVLSTPENKLSGEAGRLMAVAKGNGVVEICDVALENREELQIHGMKSRNFSQNKNSKGKVRQQAETVQSIHTAAVSCVTFARFSETGSIVVSGSNDRSIKLWTWNKKDMKESSSCSSTSVDRGPMTLSINHRKKVNWLCTAATSSENLFVADTSRLLTVYTVL